MLCSQIPKFNDLINNILQKSFVVSQNRINSKSVCQQKTNTKILFKNSSLLPTGAPTHDRFLLGISPETLSRVRAQATENKIVDFCQDFFPSNVNGKRLLPNLALYH
jgi:hypothetical protein